MNTGPITIKPLAEVTVLCEFQGCEKPAGFLISQRTPKLSYTAYCDLHTRKLAERTRAALPPAPQDKYRSGTAG